MELHMCCWEGGGLCFNSSGVFSWELFSAEPENSWWRESVGVVWFSCSNFILKESASSTYVIYSRFRCLNGYVEFFLHLPGVLMAAQNLHLFRYGFWDQPLDCHSVLLYQSQEEGNWVLKYISLRRTQNVCVERSSSYKVKVTACAARYGISLWAHLANPNCSLF